MNIQLFEWNYKTTVTYDNIVDFIMNHFPKTRIDDDTICQHLKENTPLSISEYLSNEYRFHKESKTKTQQK